MTVVEDTASGTLSWRARAIGQLLGQAQAGDVIVAAEVSRLARSTLQVLDILEVAATKGISAKKAPAPSRYLMFQCPLVQCLFRKWFPVLREGVCAYPVDGCRDDGWLARSRCHAGGKVD